MRFHSLIRSLRRAVLGCTLATALCLSPQALAQSVHAAPLAKISVDLSPVLEGGAPVSVPCARVVSGRLLVRALVLASSDDASLDDLRRYVLSVGGAVTYHYGAMRGLVVMLPANRLLDLARRSDVVAIAPNRSITRSGSLLQVTTGSAEAGAAYRGKLDGSGIGVAVLDSGIAASHQNLQAPLLGPVRRSRVLVQGLLSEPHIAPA